MHVALIGYGEVGRILAEDLRADGHEVTAFDLKLDDRGRRPDAGAQPRSRRHAGGVATPAPHAGPR